MTEHDVDKLFSSEHLPADLAYVSASFHDLACRLQDELASSAERTIALRKLWESKNYAVWCAAQSNE